MIPVQMTLGGRLDKFNVVLVIFIGILPKLILILQAGVNGMKRSVIIFTIVFIISWVCLSFCVPGFRLKMDYNDNPIKYIIASLVGMFWFKSILSFGVGIISGLVIDGAQKVMGLVSKRILKSKEDNKSNCRDNANEKNILRMKIIEIVSLSLSDFELVK